MTKEEKKTEKKGWALVAKRELAVARCPKCGKSNKVTLDDHGVKMCGSLLLPEPVEYRCRRKVCWIRFSVSNPSELPGYGDEEK